MGGWVVVGWVKIGQKKNWPKEGALQLLLLSNRLHYLLLLRRLLLDPLLSDSRHLRCFHGFVRLSEQ